MSPDLAARVRSLGGAEVRLTPVAALPVAPVQRAPAQVRAELGADDRPLVVAAGRLHAQKSFDVLVRAACGWRPRRPQPVVVVAGDGPLRDELTNLVRALDSPVCMLGHRSDVGDLLAAADVVVVPSRWEGRSLLVQEAMRAGAAIVAAATGGTPALVEDGAVLVPYGDAIAITGAVDRLLDDPEGRRDLGGRARAISATWPSAEEVAAETLDLYVELLGRTS